MDRKESKRRQNVTHIVLLFVTVVIYRTHLYCMYMLNSTVCEYRIYIICIAS